MMTQIHPKWLFGTPEYKAAQKAKANRLEGQKQAMAVLAEAIYIYGFITATAQANADHLLLFPSGNRGAQQVSHA